MPTKRKQKRNHRGTRKRLEGGTLNPECVSCLETIPKKNGEKYKKYLYCPTCVDSAFCEPCNREREISIRRDRSFSNQSGKCAICRINKLVKNSKKREKGLERKRHDDALERFTMDALKNNTPSDKKPSLVSFPSSLERFPMDALKDYHPLKKNPSLVSSQIMALVTERNKLVEQKNILYRSLHSKRNRNSPNFVSTMERDLVHLENKITSLDNRINQEMNT